MSLQYIHTSARRGLEPGKSGFCCVARDRDLPVDLGKELERLSRYEHILGKPSPVILRHMKLSVRSGNYHILSRLSDSGADYSKRNNHIAHHLAFLEDEATRLPDPATILLFWTGWRKSWNEPPRVLVQRDQFAIQDLDTNEDTAVSVFQSAVTDGCYQDAAFTIEEGEELDLALHFRNELLSLPATQRWEIPFTNFILTSDQPTLFSWRGNWKDRPLPFEFEPKPEKDPPPDPPETPEPIDSPPEEELETSVPDSIRNAPKVEIPAKLTRAHRKRPKLRWTRRRLSKTLNLSLAILAILCIVTSVYLLQDISSPENSANGFTPPNTQAYSPLQTDPSGPGPVDAREEWRSLVESNQLFERIDRASELANQLLTKGDANPTAIAQTLSAIKTAVGRRGGVGPTIVYIPSAQVTLSENQWVLDRTIASEVQPLNLRLVPEGLFPLFEEPLIEFPAFELLREQFQHDRFIPEDTVVSLKAVGRAAKDSLAQNDLEAIAAAEEYRALWQSLERDDNLKSIQELETAFNLNPFEGFFAIDDDGLLMSPNQNDLSVHIKNLFEQFMLPRFSSFKTTPEFRETLKGANLQHDSAIELAKSIWLVLQAAETFTTNLEPTLARIRSKWEDTFVRDDLMEETIINFNLERLANSKRSLAELQFQFTRDTIVALDSTGNILNAVQTAENAIQAIDSESTWGLIYRNP